MLVGLSMVEKAWWSYDQPIFKLVDRIPEISSGIQYHIVWD
jgi:hypothetical protein